MENDCTRDLRRDDGSCRSLRGPCSHFKKCDHGCGDCGICHHGCEELIKGRWTETCKRADDEAQAEALAELENDNNK